ncbi:MAG: TadE family type IV pilus minor pilin [Mycolicibacterium sp.]|uniref:TadE family type IV pilus minor pilin n=1 Tax=Mycolicibacterium sp. TaxID=2320850 RepID=UPI003D0F8939
MEAAFAIIALVAILSGSIAGLTAVSMQVRCVDAAREAARLAARGDDGGAERAVRAVGPRGALLRLRRSGGHVVAVVTSNSVLLPGVSVGADAVAALEPGVG